MAQAEPSNNITTISGGNDGGATTVGAASSSVVDDRYATPSASMLSSSRDSREYKPPALSEAQVLAAIKKSREQGWSELADRGPAVAVASSRGKNARAIWEELKRSNHAFKDVGEDVLKLGRRITEEGLAHIYEASLGNENYSKVVAKVFKVDALSLTEFKRQWPLATKAPVGAAAMKSAFGSRGEVFKCCSHLHLGTFLKDGRFAFVIPRFWGDLRKLIDVKLSEKNYQGPPFSYPQALWIMNIIATGMGDLHSRGVLHKDLKAANVLFFNLGGGFNNHFCVEDFKTSKLVQGTGFWRAPEVLEELLKNPSDQNEKIWTKKMDSYSYAMTCYEVLTGHIPFFGYDERDWKRVIDGERPHLPDYVDPKLQEIVERCWHKEPSERPAFEVIQAELQNMMRPINMDDYIIEAPL